jgi:hypothetical protein
MLQTLLSLIRLGANSENVGTLEKASLRKAPDLTGKYNPRRELLYLLTNLMPSQRERGAITF